MADHRRIAAFVLLNEILFDEDMEIVEMLEEPRTHRYWVRPWIKDRQDEMNQNTSYKLQEELILYDDTYEFRTMLRMTPDVYYAILDQLRDRIRKKDTNWRPSEHRLSITLKYLAFGEHAASLSETYRIGRCTVARIIKDTCEAIFDQFHEEYIVLPSTEDEWVLVANDFDKRWNYPCCLGALDGKHIRIEYPPKSGSLFFNYKKFFSIVLMALCNSNYEFMYVDVGAEGRAADGRIWNQCSLKAAMDGGDLHIPGDVQLHGANFNTPFHIIADNAFALTRHLQKPFCRRLLTQREQIYNYRLTRARRLVENCFGILSSRFQIFKQEIKMNPDAATKIVLAAVTLHNILRKCCGQAYITNILVDREDVNHNLIPGQWRQGIGLEGLNPAMPVRNPTREAKQIRENMANYFLTPYGEVRWQYDHIIR